MTKYSACIEWLFADAQSLPPLPGTPEANIVEGVAVSFPDRIRWAKAAGLDAVEFWHWSSKDLDAVKAALDETGLPLAGILCEPIAQITDPEHGHRRPMGPGSPVSLSSVRSMTDQRLPAVAAFAAGRGRGRG